MRMVRVMLASMAALYAVSSFAAVEEIVVTAYVVMATQPLAGLISGGGPAGARGFAGWYGPPSVWGVQFSWRGGN